MILKPGDLEDVIPARANFDQIDTASLRGAGGR
jgi:hypothetical protein